MEREKVYEKNSIEIFKLTDRIYFRYASWDDRQQCNGGYIVFKDFVAAVDAPSIEGANEMLAEVAQLFGKPVKYIILTHGHWDHAGGLPVFVERGATVIGSRNMLKKLNADGVTLPELSIGVESSALIEISDMAFELFTIAGAVHSEEDLFIKIPSENLIFTGDAVAELENLFFGNGDFNNWLSALGAMEAMKFSTICVGHGRIKDGSHFAIQKAYFNALNDAVNAQIANMEQGALNDKSAEAPAKFAKAAVNAAGNAGAKKAVEMAGESIAEKHIAALFAKRQL